MKITCPHCGRELNRVELLSVDGDKIFCDNNPVIYAFAFYRAFCDDCKQLAFTEKEITIDLEEIAKGELEC